MQLIGLISEQLRECWQAPPSARSLPDPPVASLRITLNQDGSLAAEPEVVNERSDRLFQAVGGCCVKGGTTLRTTQHSRRILGALR